jgi:hypothetical protein
MENIEVSNHINLDLNKFGFVNREKNINGFLVKNRCGRDFLYYALNFIDPEEFNPNNFNPVNIEKNNIFGLRLPSSFIWTGLTFKNIPKLLSDKGYFLTINSIKIKSYLDIVYSLFFKAPKNFSESMEILKNGIDDGKIVGIDISISLGGLIDHVMFVYGYDRDNLYVFDTHKAYSIDYTKITPEHDNRFIMKLPFNTVEKSWTRFSRIWLIEKSL